MVQLLGFHMQMHGASGHSFSGSQLLLARPEIFNFMPLICLPRVKDRLEDFK